MFDPNVSIAIFFINFHQAQNQRSQSSQMVREGIADEVKYDDTVACPHLTVRSV